MAALEQEEEVVSNAGQAALSDRLPHFAEALGVLYIRNNLSGRNKFRERWPEAASFLFGPELIKFDDEGVEDEDRARRAVLEDEASGRRAALLAKIAEIPHKSVLAGALEFDYVGDVLDMYNPDIALLLYKEEIIERVRPGFTQKAQAKIREKEVQAQEKLKKRLLPGLPLPGMIWMRVSGRSKRRSRRSCNGWLPCSPLLLPISRRKEGKKKRAPALWPGRKRALFRL